MPRTRRTRVSRRVTSTDQATPSAEDLSSLTVNALKARLRDRGLSTLGNKATLIDRLSQHVRAHPAAQNGSTGTEITATNATQGDPSTSTQSNTTQRPPNLPENLLQQLTTYLQQVTPIRDAPDDQISVASDLQPTQQRLPPPIANALPPPASIQGPQPRVVYPVQPQAHQSTTTPLPPVPPRILEKISSGAYIDFTTLTSKSMFGTPEPAPPQSLTLQLTPSGDSFAIQPTNSSKRITSFIDWLEAWNIFMAITVAHKPSQALQLIAYQSIISSASAHYPLNAWLNYDMHFRIMAASDPTIRWDVRHSDLWLKWITPFVRQPQSGRFPCSHCGSTSHYPENCNFRPSVAPNTPRTTNRKVSPTATSGIPICIDFNRSQCFRTPCRFLHKCEHCGANHSGKTCPSLGWGMSTQ